MKVLVDTNIILDVLLDRAPFAMESSRVWEACDTGQLEGSITASTVTDIFYIARRTVNSATARVSIGWCMATFGICPIDRQTLEYATLLPGDDFEDNVQIAAAMIGRFDAIVTRNGDDFTHAPLPILTPTALLTLLPTQPTP